jgi:8-oxo-dGTP diphosphatase
VPVLFYARLLYNQVMARSAAIIIHGNEIALIKRRREGRLYYVFPGGQVEEKESPEQAAVREVEEELGLKMEVDRLIVKVIHHSKMQYYFLARIKGGKFGTGLGPEMRGLYPPERGSYHPIWMPLANILKENVVPREVAEIVSASLRQGWPQEVVTLNEDAFSK